MGMIVGLRRVSPEELELLSSLSHPTTEEDWNDVMENYSFAHDEADALDLDKSWNGLHFLLTGTADGDEEPLCYLLTGGKIISPPSEGYERLLTPAEVADFDNALTALAPDDLRARFDASKMMESVYPAIWDRDPAEDDTLGWLLDYYEELRDFVSATAVAGEALVVDLSV